MAKSTFAAGPLLAKILGPIEEQLKELRRQEEEIGEQIAMLEDMKRKLAGSALPSVKRAASKIKTTAPKAKAGKRVRRTEEQLKELAGEVHAFIKSKGDGVKGGEIGDKFGKIQPTVKEFLKKFGFKVKTEGKKAGMTYHAD